MEDSDQRDVSFGGIRCEYVGRSEWCGEVDDATRYGGVNVNVVWRRGEGGMLSPGTTMGLIACLSYSSAPPHADVA